MAGCGCSIANLGYGSCGEVFDVTRKLIFVRTYDNDGVRNKISTSDLVDGVLPEAFITAKLIATPDKRWYPIGDFNAVVEATGEDVEFTDDFGANFSYLAIGFPITKWWKSGIGIVPLTSIGYNIEQTVEMEYDGSEVITTYSGEGGITNFYFDNSFKIIKSLSVGFKAPDSLR